MKIKFNIEDETVVTSNTVKVIVNISGQVADGDRASHEARARALAAKFIAADWAYSNFSYGSNGLTFSVTATCRIPAEQNEELHQKAADVSDRSTTLTINHLDLSVPPRDLAVGESRLRKRMLERAQEAAAELGDFEVTEIEFAASYRGGSAKSMVSNATYSVGAESGEGLGHSEKIALSGEVTVESTTTTSQANQVVGSISSQG